MKLLFILLLAGVLLAAYAPGVRADQPQHIYLAEDEPRCQLHPLQGQDNFDNCVDGWWWTGQAVEWWSFSAEMRNDVVDIIGSWHDAIDYLYYHEALYEETARLQFVYRANPCGNASFAGCRTVAGSTYDDIRNAEYVDMAIIKVNSLLVPSPSGPLARAVLAHELGHQYGLGERYSTDLAGFTVCTTYEGTVMNTIKTTDPNYPGCPWREGPTGLDKQRVNAFWSGGDPRGELRGDLPILGNGVGPVATYLWQDMAWTELNQRIRFYYWSGTAWVQYRKDDNTLYEIDIVSSGRYP